MPETIELGPNDAAIVFRSDDSIHLHIPDDEEGDEKPASNILILASAIFYNMKNAKYITSIIDRFVDDVAGLSDGAAAENTSSGV